MDTANVRCLYSQMNIMKIPSHLLFSFFLSSAVLAGETPRRSLDDQDFVLIRETNLKYNACLQEKAMEKIDEYPDIRQVAAQAVDACRVELEKLIEEFDKSNLDPNFYHGLVNNIKTRGIRQLMPLLMMEKSKSP